MLLIYLLMVTVSGRSLVGYLKNKVLLNSSISWSHVNYFHASGGICRVMILFANSSDPDQDWQNVGPDLDPNFLTF